MNSIIKTLIEKNFQYKKAKITKDNKGMLDALLHILVCLEQKRNVPVWMEDQKEHYLINAVHAAKDRIKELCSHENESNKLKFELVQCFFISCFLAKEYSQYQEIDWINDYANNNIKRALARLDDIENSGSEIDVFQSTLIKSLIEKFTKNILRKIN